jgi:peptidoglycan lytic transglycosylase
MWPRRPWPIWRRMRPERVAASVALTVALASVVGVAAVGSQQPTAFRPVAQGFRPVVVGGMPTMAILPDPADLSAGRLSADGPFVEPAQGVDPTGRPPAAQPTSPLGVIAIPTPTPMPTVAPPRTVAALGPKSDSGSAWQYDPEVSWYGPGFYGSRTACGETLTTSLLGVANRTLPCGTLVTFRDPATGRVVTAPVVDRGPYVSGRQWDLTGGLCLALAHCYTGPIDWHL